MAGSSMYSRSSSTIVGRWTYDVFLSFRGEDTRQTFVDHLYKALETRGIYTFRDDQRLMTGKPISEQLPAAIDESRFAIVVFSENYADSSWCLDELAHINDCRTEIRQIVVPVFYDVHPSVVRRQLKSFEIAFQKHEERFTIDKIQKWRDALFQIAGLSGFHVPTIANGHESECITLIVHEICSKCRPFLNFERNLVGINSRVQDLKSLLGTESDVVRFVGIWGIGGSGKTTLAWALYNEISYQFEGKSFVENVKEHARQCGLEFLQKKVLSEILLDKSFSVNSVREGIGLMGSRLQRRKVLLVLDDVDDDAQLNALAASHVWFGKGSRIIVTTRDQRWITRPTSFEKFNALLLNHMEAIKLFSLYAFGKDSPPEEFNDDSNYLVQQAGGFPLALISLGASLYDCTMDEWRSTLSRLEVEGEDEVSKMLKASYDGLSEIDQKILLDIACFFKGEKLARVIQILDSFDFHAHFGIKRLVQRSLIFVSDSRIYMHDRIQEMGWQIVRKSTDLPGQHSRLWLRHDACHVLMNSTGTAAIEGISFSDSYDLEDVNLDSRSFRNMNKLRLLKLKNNAFFAPKKKVGWLSKASKYLPSHSRTSLELEYLSNLRWLTWEDYDFHALPVFFATSNLVGLEMPNNMLVKLWGKGELPNRKKSLDKLRYLDLTSSYSLQRTPDINFAPNLQTLILVRCWNLVEVDSSIGDHEQLVFLSLEGCTKLQSFPSNIGMKSLETLILSDCNELRIFPDIKANMKKLSKLYLDRTSIEELPVSVGNLSGLVLMDLSHCTRLSSLPSSFCELRSLKTLYATKCSRLRELPENLGQIQSLEGLWLDGTRVRIPSSMALMKNLKIISLRKCSFFRDQPPILSFHSMRSLILRGCDLSNDNIPDGMSRLLCLEELDLSYNYFTHLPQGICNLPRLKNLNVSFCELEELEALPSNIAVLRTDIPKKTSILTDLSTKYDSLWKISSYNSNGPTSADPQYATCILKSLLKGLLVANHRFSLLLVKGCHIPKWFTEGSHPYTLLPLNWYKEDILGFAVSSKFFMSENKPQHSVIDIQFDLIEESNLQYVPKTSAQVEPIPKSVWLGFFSFNFFRLLFPEFPLDNWSTFRGTVGVSSPTKVFKQLAIRAVYREDVEEAPSVQKSAIVHNDPSGQPWLKHHLSKDDMQYLYPDTSSYIREFPSFSPTTAYLKERGCRHARLLFNV